MIPTAIIVTDHPAVADAASSITEGTDGDAPRVRALFEWVRDEIAYDIAPDLDGPTSWRASDTLARWWGFCQQKAVLLAALLRSIDIPSALAFQSVIDHTMPDRFTVYRPQKRMRPHGLAAVLFEGRWQLLDPSIHRGMCERRGLQLVEWSPGTDAVLPRFDLAGGPHCEIEEDLGVYSTLPDHVVEATMALNFLHADEFKQAARRNLPRPVLDQP